MDHKEQDQLHKTIDKLISKANGWDMLDKFFKENIQIKKYYEEARDEAWKSNCQSYPITMIITIEKLLDELDRE